MNLANQAQPIGGLMSDRPLIGPVTVLNASTATSLTSHPTIIQRLPGISYELVWTGTTAGTFAFQVSNSFKQAPDGTALVAGTWTALDSSVFQGTIPSAGGSPGSGFVDVMGTEAYAIRVVFTRSSGTGNLTITACAKVW